MSAMRFLGLFKRITMPGELIDGLTDAIVLRIFSKENKSLRLIKCCQDKFHFYSQLIVNGRNHSKLSFVGNFFHPANKKIKNYFVATTTKILLQ